MLIFFPTFYIPDDETAVISVRHKNLLSDFEQKVSENTYKTKARFNAVSRPRQCTFLTIYILQGYCESENIKNVFEGLTRTEKCMFETTVAVHKSVTSFMDEIVFVVLCKKTTSLF